jgi:hypothetical protein
MIPKFFGIPPCVIRSGVWAEMTPSEQGLYVCLMHDSERYRTRELTSTDAQLRGATGLSPRSLRDARIKLQERGLVHCERGTGNVYRYVICNPETGQPYPGDPKKRVPYIKKGDTEPDGGAPAQEATPAATARRQPPQRYNDDLEKPKPLDSYGLVGVFDAGKIC